MRKQSTAIIAWVAAALVVASGVPVHAFMFDFVPSKGPDGLGSNATFNTYGARAVDLLEDNMGTLGDPLTDPAAYVPKAEVSPNVYQASATEMIVSSFPSWDAQASPTGNFANQTGNRIYFGVRILGEGTQFALHNLEFDADSNDASNFFDPLGRNFNGSSYNARRIGIDYGTDNMKGTADDMVYDNGESGAFAIDELIYVGEDVSLTSGTGLSTDQDNLNNAVGVINDLGIFSIFGTYTLFADSNHTPGTELVGGSGTAELVIPEPSSMLLLTVGLLVIGSGRLRKAQQA